MSHASLASKATYSKMNVPSLRAHHQQAVVIIYLDPDCDDRQPISCCCAWPLHNRRSCRRKNSDMLLDVGEQERQEGGGISISRGGFAGGGRPVWCASLCHSGLEYNGHVRGQVLARAHLSLVSNLSMIFTYTCALSI